MHNSFYVTLEPRVVYFPSVEAFYAWKVNGPEFEGEILYLPFTFIYLWNTFILKKKKILKEFSNFVSLKKSETLNVVSKYQRIDIGSVFTSFSQAQKQKINY